MAYRYSATGTLEVPDRYLEKVCAILSSKDIRYQRLNATSIRIEHDERAATPSRHKAEEAFEDLAPYIHKPQSVTVYSELLGESEVGFVDGRVRTDDVQTVWSQNGSAPTADLLVDGLRKRGIAAQVNRPKNGRKSSRRSRVFEIQPGSGGPGCRITIKRRFWDSYDLLSVPEVYESLCRKYHMAPERLREELYNSKFGVEVRNPALGGASSDMLFENLLELIEDATNGIRTNIS